MGSFARLAKQSLPLALAALAIPAGSIGATAPIPILARSSGLAIDRDMPEMVKTRIEREQERLRALAVEASKMPASGAAGCERSEFGSFGPPAPNVAGVRVLGHHVEVVVEFPRMPASLACRPWQLMVMISTVGARSYKNSVAQYDVRHGRGRAVVALPMYGSPPYRLVVGADSILSRRGPRVELPLKCPERCFRGYSPPLHSWTLPRPTLPLLGIDRRTLEASFWQVIEQERLPPILAAIPKSVRCPTTKTCMVTRVDPAFPNASYDVTYRIAGQQARGCWLGMIGRVSERRPYDDASPGQRMLAGCASWLR
jgi:hypothetical protein